MTGAVVAALAFFFPLKTLAELVNIGTLFAFILVAPGVIFLRRSRPDLKRPFRTPWVPVVPILSVLASLWLMLNLASTTWVRFGIWLVVGLIVYFGYSYRHSRLGRGGSGGPQDPDTSAAVETDRTARSGAPVPRSEAIASSTCREELATVESGSDGWSGATLRNISSLDRARSRHARAL